MGKLTNSPRIVSLLPSATEILFELGAGPSVVGVTHECDFPPEAALLPHCTASLLPPSLTAKQIDEAVSNALTQDPHSIYKLRLEKLTSLKPDIIVTQSLCAVCAVPESFVRDVSCAFPFPCRVVSSDPHTLSELFESILFIGDAIGTPSQARTLVDQLMNRLTSVRERVSLVSSRPGVVVIEWPDPPYAPGHWVPDMIETANGVCVLGESGQKSKRVTWEHLHALQVDVVICAFCGYDLYRNEQECDKIASTTEWKSFAKGARVYATNASAYYSRPGNRLVDGTELLAFLLHRIEAYRPKVGCASMLKDGGWIDASEL